MLTIFPIEHLLNRDIFKLSGGEKQILCIAASYISGTNRIVLNHPQILMKIISNYGNAF